MEIAAMKKNPSGKIFAETWFMSYFPGNLREPILLYVFLPASFVLATNSQKYILPLGSPENNC
jgi:hypothetical protein